MTGRSNAIDHHVGSRVRLRRTLLGISQDGLGKALGLTFQQIQKYEHGSNRISAGRLYHMAQALYVPVSYFFDDLAAESGGTRSPGRMPIDAVEIAMMARRETLELVRAYYRVADPAVRRHLAELVKAIAGPDPAIRRHGRPVGSGRKLETAVGAVA